MSTTDTINFIVNRFNLEPKQVELLQKLPEFWLLKCAQAIRVSERRGYALNIQIDGLLNYKPNPKLSFVHTYDIRRSTREYRHTISIEIRI